MFSAEDTDVIQKWVRVRVRVRARLGLGLGLYCDSGVLPVGTRAVKHYISRLFF